MKFTKALKALALVAIPALSLSVASCGGDLFGGDDMGTNICPAGTTLHPVGASYTNVVASQVVDGCNEGLTASALQGARTVNYDQASGIVTVTSNSSGTLLGSGPVKCNTGSLSYGPATVENSSCRWTTNRTVAFTATGDYQLTLVVTDNRSGTQQVSGGPTCGQPTSCTTSFTLTMTK